MTFDLGWLQAAFPELIDLKLLNQGGQKWVFRCADRDHSLCAFKLVKPGAGVYADREVEAVRRVAAPNIPRIWAHGIVVSPIGPLIWLLEQWVDGIDLCNLLKKGALSASQVLSLGADLISAAADAEAVQVVHRDIKPGNIKLDASGRAWLLDFGIARVLDLDSITCSDAISGPHSLGYSAPEQVRNRKHDIDGRSDLFAIGVVLYEAAIGTNPFLMGARDRLEILQRVETVPLPLLNLSWDSSHDFAYFVSSLTQKYRHQRPTTCREALEWFTEIQRRLGGT